MPGMGHLRTYTALLENVRLTPHSGSRDAEHPHSIELFRACLARIALARASIRAASVFRAVGPSRAAWFSRLVAARLAAGVLIAARSDLGQ